MADGISVILIILVFVILLAWVVVIIVMFVTKSGIFKEYKHPPAPENAVYPNGDIIPLTPEEKEKKKKLIEKFIIP